MVEDNSDRTRRDWIKVEMNMVVVMMEVAVKMGRARVSRMRHFLREG